MNGYGECADLFFVYKTSNVISPKKNEKLCFSSVNSQCNEKFVM